MTKVARRRTTPAEPEPEAVASGPFLGHRHGRVVVGIDGSLTGTAICFLDLDTGEHEAYRHKPKTRGVQRLVEIQRFIYEKCHGLGLVSDEVCMVVMEEYGFAGKGKVFHMGEGGGAIKLGLIQALGIQRKVAYPSTVSPTSLKKFVLGKGVGEKSDMKIQVFKRWGVEFSDDNECDAYGLAQVAACLIEPDRAANDAQREVLAKAEVHAEWPE